MQFLWPITPENYAVLEANNYAFVDFRRAGEFSRVSGIKPGDKIAVYVTKRKGIAAILEVLSRLRDRQGLSPIWADEIQEGKAIYRWRAESRLVKAGWVDFLPLWRQMKHISPKMRTLGDRGMGLYLRGVTLKLVGLEDFALIEASLASAPPGVSTESPPTTKPAQAKRRVFGSPLNFRELRHEPINEQGVVYLFGMVARELGFLVEGVAAEFPDCMAKRRTKAGYYEPVNVEFEYKAANFRQHGHNPKDCDLIVCWENDWPSCPIEVIELREEIKRL